MGKIVSVFGQEGSGKSTLATNLACALAERQKVVIVLPAQLSYGGIQVFFGENIEKDKGIFAALSDKTEQPEKKLTQCKLNNNIYILGVPNETYEVYTVAMEEVIVDKIFRKLSLTADYLIIDSTSDLYNGVTLLGLAKADEILCVYKSTISACLWNQSMDNTLRQLTEGRILPIVTEHGMGCNVKEFIKVSQIEPLAYLPSIYNATFLENAGKPIYYDKDKSSDKYKRIIDQIADKLITEERNVTE